MFVGHLPELIVVLVLVVFVFGAKRLPEVGSGLGKGIAEFRSSISDKSDLRINKIVSAAAPEPAKSSLAGAPSAPILTDDGELLHT